MWAHEAAVSQLRGEVSIGMNGTLARQVSISKISFAVIFFNSFPKTFDRLTCILDKFGVRTRDYPLQIY